MLFNPNSNLLPSTTSKDDGHLTEKVYVDWPEENSEDYRFVSSRMDDIESDFHPIVEDNDNKGIYNVTTTLTNLRIKNKPPIQDYNIKRYEDLTRKPSNRHKNSSIPPLDLISQHSSIEIPGAKGAIDIDFRSMSDSISEDYDDQEDNNDVDKDSLDEHHDQYEHNGSNIYQTTLPRVNHEELVINPGEYNSSRYSQNNAVSRRFSEITIPSQYRTVAPIEPNYGQYESANQYSMENEQAAFEAVQQRFKQTLPSTTQDHGSSSISTHSQSKIHKIKPTMHVAPLIKQPLNDKAPNFIELNKATLTQSKQVTQTSYANKFADRQRKDSPGRTGKKSSTTKEFPTATHNHTEKVDRNPPLSSQDYWSKRERSIERLTGDHRDDNSEQIPRQIYAPSHSNVIYAFTQYGEPLIINTSDVTVAHSAPRPAVHSGQPEYYPHVNIVSQNPINGLTSPRIQRSSNYNQELRRSAESDQIFHDPPYKRQPTLYDEKLLEKKTRIASSERTRSHLPPLPGSSDSSVTQNVGSGYSANLRKKEVNYEQYTLRDFKNIKQINSVGGLGPNLGTESHKQMKEKLIRQKNYSKAVKEKNQELLRIRERDNKEPPLSGMKVEDLSQRDVEQNAQNDASIQTNDRAEERDDKVTTTKSTFSSANSKVREQGAKRDVMLNYSKAIKEKQLKKQISKTKFGGSESEISKKDNDNPKMVHELFNNSDLERLLQRHESDKRMTDQIRQKWEKIN